MVFTRFSAMTLTFDLLTQSVCLRPYIHHLMLVKLVQILTKIVYLPYPVLRVIACDNRDLHLRLFDPEN